MTSFDRKRTQDWFRENAPKFGGKVFFDEPLSKHTYYRIGGPAAVLVVPQSLDDLFLIGEGLRDTQAEVFILGAGSNLLVADEGSERVVVKTTRLNLTIQMETIAEGMLVRTGTSVMVSTLLRRAAQEGWAGFECLTGIPGSIGGVVGMNAGTHLGEAKDRLVSVEVFSLAATSFATPKAAPDASMLRQFAGEELRFEYRKNLFLSSTDIIYSVVWRSELQDPALVKSRIDEILARRKASQPLDAPSCGSVFKNPRASGLHAWQVIDRLGLRGYRIGGAQFAEKHCNFILNVGNAQAADVRALIQLAKARAKDELGVELEEEVKYLA